MDKINNSLFFSNIFRCWLSGLDILYVVIPLGLVIIANFFLFLLIIFQYIAKIKKLNSIDTNDIKKNFEMFKILPFIFVTSGK